jgi:hypothetical protein
VKIAVTIILWLSGAVAVYGIVISIIAVRAVRRYRAIKNNRASMHRWQGAELYKEVDGEYVKAGDLKT